uniref:Peptidyl-tRNA hydrolase n=1 Tax=Aegilops tauschii subsp. strangulata TaxID=200361 RepID=A0A452ZS11_AEGTS
LLSGVPASRLTSPRISFARSSRRSMGANGPPSGTAASSSSSSATAGAGGGAAQKPWLFVGLGNPGRMYKGTRHNVGFEMIDAIAEAEGISVSTKQFKSMVGKGLIGDVPVMLAKPQTFMNASGESVGQLVSYFKIPLNQVVLIYDDLDLPFAKLRLLPKGGHGGHNGMRSVIHHLKQSRDFPRLRVGMSNDRFFNAFVIEVTNLKMQIAQMLCRHWTANWNDGSHRFCSTCIQQGRTRSA